MIKLNHKVCGHLKQYLSNDTSQYGLQGVHFQYLPGDCKYTANILRVEACNGRAFYRADVLVETNDEEMAKAWDGKLIELPKLSPNQFFVLGENDKVNIQRYYLKKSDEFVRTEVVKEFNAKWPKTDMFLPKGIIRYIKLNSDLFPKDRRVIYGLTDKGTDPVHYEIQDEECDDGVREYGCLMPMRIDDDKHDDKVDPDAKRWERRAQWYRRRIMAERDKHTVNLGKGLVRNETDYNAGQRHINVLKSELHKYQFLLEKAKVFLSDEDLAKVEK